MRKSLHKIYLALALLTISQATVVATNYYASPSGSGDGLSASSPTTISNAINTLANTTGDVVILAAGTYSVSSQIKPIAQISISGVDTSSTIIDGGNTLSQIFDIEYNCNISNITVQNSSQNNYSAKGGAFQIQSTSEIIVTLNNIKVTGCSAFKGNAIYAKNANITVNSSNLSGNEFGSGNGYGGALYLDNCTTNINNTTIAYNLAEKGSGIYATNGTLTIESCNINNNGKNPATDSDFQGGGIFLSDCDASINNSKIKNNLAFSGAGIYAASTSSNSLNIDNTNIYSNSTNPDGSGQGLGGGLYLKKYNTDFSYCSLSDNTAGLNGGSMFICGGSTNLEYCTLSYNNKTVDWSYGSGGVYISNLCGTGTLDISYSIISGNESNDATWMWVTAGDDTNADASSGAITIENSIIGSDVYDDSENVTSSDFDPDTDLGEIDEDGYVAVTDATYSGYGCLAGIPHPSFLVSPSDTICSENIVTYTTQSGFHNYSWTITGNSPVDYEITAGGLSSTDYSVTLVWHTTGNQTISVNYENSNGKPGTSAIESTTYVKATPILTIANSYICGSGTSSFHAESSITGTIISWYDSLANGTLLNEGENYTTALIDTTTSYYVSGNYNGCTTSRTEVTVHVAADTTHWTGSSSSFWDDEANWSPSRPGDCSVIIIEKGTFDPDISTYGLVNCKDIIFQAETSIYGLENLDYERAFVQTDLKRNKWYLLTTPLKEMYSGDYYFNGAPVTNMKLFGTSNASSGTFNSSYTMTGNFTQSFASLTEDLEPGEGFAFQIDSSSWNYPNGLTNNTGDTVIVFPRTNADGSLVRSAIPYSALTGKLYPSIAKTMVKDSVKAYRFAMENESNELDSIKIPVKAGLNLIGNPLMSHLDFGALYANNNSLISPYVQFWNGQTFGTITTSGATSGASVEGLSLKIPPMKSFVVNALQDGELVIKLSDFSPNGDVTLKAARTSQNKMYIEAANKKSKSSSAIILNQEADNTYDNVDVCKLCSQIEEVPEVYTIVGQKALDINQIGKFPCVVPVGIKSGLKDTVNLDFKGVETFEGIEVRLINTATGEDIDLKENSNYTYDYDGSNGEGNLFLQFRSATVTDDDLTSSTSDINIYADENKEVHIITSPDNKALEIQVFNALGQLVTRKTALSNTSETVSINQQGSVFIVKVISEKGVETKKIIL